MAFLKIPFLFKSPNHSYYFYLTLPLIGLNLSSSLLPPSKILITPETFITILYVLHIKPFSGRSNIKWSICFIKIFVIFIIVKNFVNHIGGPCNSSLTITSCMLNYNIQSFNRFCEITLLLLLKPSQNLHC